MINAENKTYKMQKKFEFHWGEELLADSGPWVSSVTICSS
jgi:hypothetical protein